jgi:hypothetical protein
MASHFELNQTQERVDRGRKAGCIGQYGHFANDNRRVSQKIATSGLAGS